MRGPCFNVATVLHIASAFCSVGLLAVLYSPVETDAPPTYLERTIAELSAGPWVLDTDFFVCRCGVLSEIYLPWGWVYVVDVLAPVNFVIGAGLIGKRV